MEEAAALGGDVAEVNSGARAFVRLGLRLLVIKRREPHGSFIPWLHANCPQLKKSQLYSAMTCARQLLKLHEIELSDEISSALEICDTHLEPFSELLHGKSQRALLTKVRDEREDEAEKRAKFECEVMFENDPELRDEWEPLILGGEKTYCQAIRGIGGQTATKGQKRLPADYDRLLRQNFKTIQNGFAMWEELQPETRGHALADLKSATGQLPDEALASAGLQRIQARENS